ncbi:YdcF family protein [Qipengyuania sp. MTN3-11]|uniref:YdcF family protein n=1 Tax=Qipengyuania sp. MTN3-11 TaxID=3056557 RepID=UPI0036F21392
MILRFLAFFLMAYALAFLGFAVSLPQPLGEVETDAILVPTGGAGRIQRGLEVLRADQAPALFISGVDPEVTPGEFAEEFGVTSREMDCCVTLGKLAVDTRSNAGEAAQWLAENDYRRVRLVTTDWHMRRAASEMRDALPGHIALVEDAVPSDPDLGQLFLEYNKLIAAVVSQGLPGQG